MCCGNCGVENPEGSKFCRECGGSLTEGAKGQPQIADSRDGDQPSPGSLAAMRPKMNPIFVLGAGIAIVMVLLSILASVGKKEVGHEPAKNQQEPPSAGVTLHAYELLRDPYTYKGKTVVLDPFSRPTMLNGPDGPVSQYNSRAHFNAFEIGLVVQGGNTGLRFEKMLSKDQGLFDVTGSKGGFADSEVGLGQVVVISSPGSPRDLEIGRDWVVEPLGSSEGTKSSGGAATVPLLRFWRYASTP